MAGYIDYCETNGVILPKRLIGQYAKTIKEALEDGISDKIVRRALWDMFRDGIASRPSLLPNRIVQVQTGPERRSYTSPHTPYRNPVNQDAFDDWAPKPRVSMEGR